MKITRRKLLLGMGVGAALALLPKDLVPKGTANGLITLTVPEGALSREGDYLLITNSSDKEIIRVVSVHDKTITVVRGRETRRIERS